MRCSSCFLVLVLLFSWAAHEAYAQRASSATQTVTFAVRRSVPPQSPGLQIGAGEGQRVRAAVESPFAQKKITASVRTEQEYFRHVDLRDEEEKLAGYASPLLSKNIASVTVSASPDHRPLPGDSNLLQDRGLLLTVTD